MIFSCATYAGGSGPPITHYNLSDPLSIAGKCLSTSAKERDEQPQENDPICLAFAGDIACSPGNSDWNNGDGVVNNCRHKWTSQLLYKDVSDSTSVMADLVVTLGDQQYYSGRTEEFYHPKAYHETWGKPEIYDITIPVIGTHAYYTRSATQPLAKAIDNATSGIDNKLFHIPSATKLLHQLPNWAQSFFDPSSTASGWKSYFKKQLDRIEASNSDLGIQYQGGHTGKAYYSFDVGQNWHIIVLNSNCVPYTKSITIPRIHFRDPITGIDLNPGSDKIRTIRLPGVYELNQGGAKGVSLNGADYSCHSDQPQLKWLVEDLEKNKRKCVMAVMHNSRFSNSDHHLSNPHLTPFWEILSQENGASLVVSAHSHMYERFYALTPDGDLPSSAIDKAYTDVLQIKQVDGAIPSVVAGIGGKSHEPIKQDKMAGTVVSHRAAAGILMMGLMDDGRYAFDLKPVTESHRDHGSEYGDFAWGYCKGVSKDNPL